MIWTAEQLRGWRVEVDDRVLLDEAEATVRVLDDRGAQVRAWRVWIATAEPGRPVYWQEGGGRPRCDGGPSHPFLDMARRRAEGTLQGVVQQVVGGLQGLILERGRADAAAGA